MKHLTLRDVASILLGGVSFLAIVLIAGMLESGPVAAMMPFALVLSFLLWAFYIAMTIRDRNAARNRPKLKIFHNGRWVDVADLPWGVDRAPTHNQHKEQA